MAERFRWTHSSANQRPSLSSFSADSFSINQGQSACVTGLRESECTCRVAAEVLKKELQMSLSPPVLSDSSSCFVIPVALLQVRVCDPGLLSARCCCCCCCCFARLWHDCRQDDPSLLSLLPSHAVSRVRRLGSALALYPGLKWQADPLRTSPLFLQNKSGRPQPHSPLPPPSDLKHPFFLSLYLRSGPHSAGGDRGGEEKPWGPPCAH